MTIEAGQQLSHYRLIEKIGEGGMGVVWKAEDTRLHRNVALKFVSEAGIENPDTVDRHLREARAVASLNHPNICAIYDIGEWEGRRFIVMELLEGRGLDEQIQGEPLDIETAIELAIQIADALGAAHAKSIVHRDVKPANLFVTNSGQSKVLDFGIAKLSADSEGQAGPDDATRTSLDVTTPGSVVGTVSYMSPEQALGKPLDARTDVFSLGVVLYEMITGRRAFDGVTSAALFDAILNRAPTAPVELNSDVPIELQRVVNRAIEKDPAVRYQSAADLVADLKRLKRDASDDRAVTDPLAATARGRRPRSVVIASIIVVVTLVALFVVATRTTLLTSESELKPAPGTAASDSSGRPTIAVLPFTNTSGEADQEFFSQGLTEEIINGLARYRELSVISKLATTDYKSNHPELDTRDAGAVLGAQYILEGSVVKVENQIRVSVQLSDTSDGRSAWGTKYDRELTTANFFSIQDDVTAQVVNAIAGMYGALARVKLESLRRKPPESLDSYACVVLGYEYLYVHTDETHLRARECLEAAIEAEPNYAEGLAWLAYMYAEEYHHRRNERIDEYDALDRALELGLEAVQLDNTSHYTHGFLTFTYFFRGDYERGSIQGHRAIELMPQNAMWLALLGIYLSQIEDFEQGIPMLRRSRELDPNPPAWLGMGFFLDHYMHDRYEEALESAKRIRLGDDFRMPMFLAAAYGQLGRAAEAAPWLEELRNTLRFPLGELRAELISRQSMSPAISDRLIEGLTKAGLELEP